MKHLLDEIRHNPLLWLLALVPVVLFVQFLNTEAHTLLFLLTIAMLIPSMLAEADATSTNPAFTHSLSVGLSVLLIITYALGLVFSLKTHREFFASAEHGEAGEPTWPLRLALVTLAAVTVLVALGSGG